MLRIPRPLLGGDLGRRGLQGPVSGLLAACTVDSGGVMTWPDTVTTLILVAGFVFFLWVARR